MNSIKIYGLAFVSVALGIILIFCSLQIANFIALRGLRTLAEAVGISSFLLGLLIGIGFPFFLIRKTTEKI